MRFLRSALESVQACAEGFWNMVLVVCTVVSRTGVVPLDVARAHRELRITALVRLVSWTVDTQQNVSTHLLQRRSEFVVHGWG